MELLLRRRCWIFDLDGTLTHPVHDFARMRRELGIPDGVGTLEGIAALPEEVQEERWELLGEIGWEYALQTRPNEGALELLEELERRGLPVAIVTRNNRRNTDETLRRLGIHDRLPAEDVITRDEHPAKPAPDALLHVLARRAVPPSTAVMVGDAIYDVEAGRAAGTATVLLDPAGDSPHRPLADHSVASLREIAAALAAA